MKNKKSLIAATSEAVAMSVAHPTITYYVLDKKKNKAVCSGSDWVCRQRMLEGYELVAKYLNGKEI